MTPITSAIFLKFFRRHGLQMIAGIVTFSIIISMTSCAGGRGGVSVDEKIKFLLPLPRHVEYKSGRKFIVTPETIITIDENLGDSEKVCAKEIGNALVYMSKIPLTVEKKNITSGIEGIVIADSDDPALKEMLGEQNLLFSPEMADEGYIMDVSSRRIIIAAPEPAGRLYGVQTLIQSMAVGKNDAVVPGIFVRDWPQMDIRGIVDDISHGQVSTSEDFKRIVENLARYKLNTYFLYIEDMFTPVQYPLIGASNGAFSARMITALQSYADPYNVAIVPVFPWPGNLENILAIPEFAGLATFPGSACFDITNPEAAAFLTGMLTEMMDAFPAPYFVLRGNHNLNDLGVLVRAGDISENELRDIYLNHVALVDSIAGVHQKQVFFSVPEVWKDMSSDLPRRMGIFHEVKDVGQLPEPVSGRPLLFSAVLEKQHRSVPDYRRLIDLLPAASDWIERHDASGLTVAVRHRDGTEVLREEGWTAYLHGAAASWNLEAGEKERTFAAIVSHHYGKYNERLEQTIRDLWMLEENPPRDWNTHKEFWRTPFTRTFSPKEIRYMESLSDALGGIEGQLRAFRSDEDEQNDPLDYLIFSARQMRWVDKKIMNINKISGIETLLEQGKGVKGTTSEAVALVSSLIQDLYGFRTEFQRLWEKTNQEKGIEFDLQRFNDQIAVLDGKISELKEGRWRQNPKTQAQWIWYNLPESSDMPAERLFFRKMFEVKRQIREVHVQVQCISHGALYVNGQYIGDVDTRAYRSPVRLAQAVKVFNVTPYVREGGNCISVEALAYPPLRGRVNAGLQFFGKIQYQDYSEDVILSDASWKVSTRESSEWQTAAFNDAEWVQPMIGSNHPEPRLERLIPDINRLPSK